MSKELKVDARILRNEIIRKAAVANMTNIAKQREDVMQGVIPIPPEKKSATEIAEDITVQAADALTNLIDLGFKDTDAQEIASTLSQGQRVAFNRAYPQIQNDFTSRFSVKNATPEFFIEYLKNYLKILKATSGIPNSIGYLQDNIISTPSDLLKLILTSENIERLRDNLTTNYGLRMVHSLTAILTSLITNLPNSSTITDLNQVMNIDPVVGFETIQDILRILKPLPSKKVIENILSAPSSTADQKRQIRNDLMDKLGVLTREDLAELDAIKINLERVIASVTVPLGLVTPPRATTPPPKAPTPPPIVTPAATPSGSSPSSPSGVPATPAPVSGTIIPPPKKTDRTALFLIDNLLNRSSGEYFNVYLFKYSDKSKNTFFALILEKLGGGGSSSGGGGADILLYGIDITDIENLFNQYEAEIDRTASGTPFNLSSLKPYSLSTISPALTNIVKYPSTYKTRLFSSAEITSMKYEQYEPAKVGFGIKKKKAPVAKKQTGLKPIRLGKGLSSKDDPYRTYDEELKLTPIRASDIIKKPSKKQVHKVSEGVEGDEYQKYDDKANRYIAFGKYAINMRQLKKGVLQIVYKSLAPNPSFPSKKIGSELQQYLFELLTNKKSLPALYKHVTEDEKKMFEKLAIFAGVFDKLNLPRINSLEDEKKEMDRFKLLHGEFVAGNDNVAVARELRNLILKFLAENRISKAKAYEYLLELNNA